MRKLLSRKVCSSVDSFAADKIILRQKPGSSLSAAFVQLKACSVPAKDSSWPPVVESIAAALWKEWLLAWMKRVTEISFQSPHWKSGFQGANYILLRSE